MPICLATETETSNLVPLLENAVLPIGLLVVGWLLKVFWDRMSQRTLFDHRVRLEKEYGLYSDLWDKLFELRRAVSDLVEPSGRTNEIGHGEQVPELFNVYQQVVRKGEPFMSVSVYRPAKEVLTLGRKIINNVAIRRSIDEDRERGLNSEADERCANKQIQLDNENEVAFNSIEGLNQQISQAIRIRVTP